MSNNMQTIQRVPFSERINYLTASDIASVVKYYSRGKKDFEVFKEFNEICSIKTWTPEQQMIYADIESKKGHVQKQRGKDWENQVSQGLQEKYQDQNEDHYTYTDTSGAEETIVHTKLKLSATPDFIEIDEINKIKTLIETKGYPYLNSEGKVTARLQSYKYQIATQLLLLALEDKQNDNEYRWNILMRFPRPYQKFTIYRQEITIEENNGVNDPNVNGVLEISLDELKELWPEILKAVKKFWKDLESSKFRLITFEEWQAENIEAEVIEIKDQEEIDMLADLHHCMQVKKQAEERENAVKNKLRDLYSNKKLVCPEFYVTISKETFATYDLTYYYSQKFKTEKKLEDINKEIDRLESGGEPKKEVNTKTVKVHYNN